MTDHTGFEKAALFHAEKYPLMQAQDFVKLAYQSAFGCGHMVSDYESVCARIESERMNGEKNVCAEDIGNGYKRLHIASGEYQLGTDAVSRLFMMSAEAVTESKDLFFAFGDILKGLSEERKIAPSRREIEQSLLKFENGDFAPVSHTEIYRAAYKPSYRVVKQQFAAHLPLICALDKLKEKGGCAIAAIDGMCASGKTTLASIIGKVLGAPVYHMDDFFLPPVKRTKERLSETGGNVDYERFRTDVLDPLLSGKPFSFRPFDCSKMDFADPLFCEPAPLSIVEGSYACHPALTDDYDYKIFLSVDPALQLERIRTRNGERMLERFKNEWIPMEMRYFEAFDIKTKADYTIHTEK